MNRILLSFIVLLGCFFTSSAQTVIFTEDFETGGPAVSTKMNTAVNGWQSQTVASVNGNNQWWWLLPADHTLNGTNAIGVSKGTLATGGDLPKCARNGNAYNNVAKVTSIINASTFESLTLDFDWAGTGDGANAYGKVCYSTNGTTWVDFPTSGTYNGQTAQQSVTNLDISAVDQSSFYIGFRYVITTGTTGSAVHSFVVDNIVIKGTPVTPAECLAATNVPVNANETCTLTTSGDTGNDNTGTFDACTGNAADDEWYKFTATSTSHKINITRSGADPIKNPVFEFFDGDCAGLVLRTCVNNNALNDNPEEEVFTCLTIGEEYYFRVYSYASTLGPRGEFTICITTPTPTLNDEPYQATPLVVSPTDTCTTSVSGTTVGATDSGIAEACDSGTDPDDDVWYTFIATQETHTIEVLDGTIDNLTVEVYSGDYCSGGLSWYACSDQTGNNVDEILQVSSLTPGDTYYVRVYSKGGSTFNEGTFTICVTTPPVPTNSDCAASTNLTVYPSLTCGGATSGTTIGANVSGVSPSDCDLNTFAEIQNHGEVWYNFIATSNWHYVTVNSSGATPMSDPVLDVREGSCTGASEECGNDFFSASTETAFIGGLTVGNTYYVRVYNSKPYGQGTFDICITTPCFPGNSTGTTTAVYPEVTAGEQGTGGVDASIACGAASSIDLEATYTSLNETDSYAVSTIPFAPPYQYDCLENEVRLENEGDFSEIIDLPWPVCFYGQTYTQMVIGGNGIVSFDTGLAGIFGGFNVLNDIPTTENSHGVNTFDLINYGPSIMFPFTDVNVTNNEGQLGWEVITTDNGGEALVITIADAYVAINETPATRFNSMLVIHKDTNIIDVFVKDKPLGTGSIHSSFNRGIIGIQDHTSTQAVVAPNRNATDAIWTATNEAYRFAPSGSAMPVDVTWYEGDSITGTQIGTGTTITVSPTSTTTYTAVAEYTGCTGTTFEVEDTTTVTASSAKQWDGSESSDWFDGDNWSDGLVPTIADCVLIPVTPNDPVIDTSANAEGLNLTIEDNASLTIQSEGILTIDEAIDVQGTAILNVESSASLIQIDDAATNTGNIYVQRSPKSDNAAVGGLNYVYWSSPVNPFDISQVSPGGESWRIWEYIPTITGNGTGNHGDWINASGNMVPGKGYIIRGLSGTPSIIPGSSFAVTSNTALFIGVPNNGVINLPLYHGNHDAGDYTGTANTATNEDDNWNLVGNPYPSAISADDFITTNTLIDGTIYLWPHAGMPSSLVDDHFYGDYVLNYDADHYIEYNSTGSVPPGINDLHIASAQSFMVLMDHAVATGSNLEFNNSMRQFSGVYNNTSFFRASNTNSKVSNTTSEKHRIWLDLINEQENKKNTILVGYVANATNGLDRLYDGFDFTVGGTNIYSIPDNALKALSIQGRPLPFQDTDKVALGISIAEVGDYKIGINTVDGLFSDNQDIYLEDTYLEVTHDLRESPYSFNSEEGVFDDRFILRYRTSDKLSTEEQVVAGELIITTPNYNTIKVKSTKENIESIDVYDVLGRTLISNNKINTSEFVINKSFSSGTYIVKVVLHDETQKIQKIVLDN